MKDNIIAADLFCGAGGTSTGLIQAGKDLGLHVELTAVNHWDTAIATHSANHTEARHRCKSLDQVNPRELFPGGRINLLVASPECTHHSRARGGKPCSDQSRSGAWRIVEWANALYIDNILIENVPEFETWGPLGVNGSPLISKKGETLRAFKFALESLGYRVDHKILNAADYGDPTCRKRFFLMARRGNKKIRWPEITHTEAGGRNLFGRTKPWVAAREIIDWNLSGQSIFDRKKPLAKKTLARIEHGLRKFGGEDFLVKLYGTGNAVTLNKPLPTVTATGQHLGVCEPFITVYKGQSKTRGVDKPLPTLTTMQNLYLCEPFILPQHAGSPDQLRVKSINQPLSTIVATGAGALVEPFIVKYNGTGGAKSVELPLDTVTTKDRFGLVETFREHPGLDIRFRMLQPHELAAAQSFPKDYIFTGTKGDTVKQIGNAVPVKMARALCMELLQ